MIRESEIKPELIRLIPENVKESDVQQVTEDEDFLFKEVMNQTYQVFLKGDCGGAEEYYTLAL